MKPSHSQLGLATLSLREQLVGTWRFVTTRVERDDGSTMDLYGPNPNGVIVFTSDGYFTLVNTRPDRPKFASNNSVAGTPEEIKAAVEGAIAYFGTYAVDETNSTYSIQISGSSFPNYEGTAQKRSFRISGDNLTFVNPAPTVGGAGIVATLERAKRQRGNDDFR